MLDYGDTTIYKDSYTTDKIEKDLLLGDQGR